MKKYTQKTQESAQTLALYGLSFLLSKEEALMHFMQTTGVDAGQLRDMAQQRSFQAAVLDYFLSDEKLLLAFAQEIQIKPETVARAARELGGGIWESDFA